MATRKNSCSPPTRSSPWKTFAPHLLPITGCEFSDLRDNKSPSANNGALPLDKTLRIYAWFLLIVTALPAAARLAKPRELARIVMLRYQDPRRRKRSRITGFVYLGLALLGIPFLLRAEVRQARWLIILLLLIVLSASESLCNSRVFNEDALARQNRLFGGVYAAIAIATALLLFTR